MSESTDTGANPRCHILPESRFLELKEVLTERLSQVAARITPENFGSLIDPLMRQALDQGFAEAGAQEGTVWLLDGTHQYLVPALNTGPNASRIVGHFRQPLNTGLVSMVLATEQPFVENAVHRNPEQSKMLDTLLGTETYALIAVPFYLLKSCRGVISCVQLKHAGSKAPEPPGFGPSHLAAVQRTATLFSRLLEYRVLSGTVGWAAD